MSSIRKAIRLAVIERLKASSTVAGQRVFGNRARPLFPGELPCILVYTKNETAEIFNAAPTEYKRSLNVVLELVAKAEKEEILDSVLDDFCDEVEQAMFNNDDFFGGVSSELILGETEMDILTEGDAPIGGAKITFTLPYYQYLPGDKSDYLDEFDTMGVRIKRDGVTEDEDGTLDVVDMDEGDDV